MTRLDHYDGPTPRAFALSPAQQSRRVRAERDTARNQLAAARRRIAELEAENRVLRRIFADAVDQTLTPAEETSCPTP